MKKNCHSDSAKGGRRIPCVQKPALQSALLKVSTNPHEILSRKCGILLRSTSLRMAIVLLCVGVILLILRMCGIWGGFSFAQSTAGIDTLKPPVVVLLDTCPPPRTIVVPTKLGDSYMKQYESGPRKITLKPPQVKTLSIVTTDLQGFENLGGLFQELLLNNTDFL